MRTLFSLRFALLFCLLISGVSHAGDLKARKPQAKRPLDAVVATPGAVTGEIIVKFRDEAQARLTASGRLTFQGVAADGKQAKKIMNRHALRTSIKASLEDMYGVMQAAEANSGIASPDLPGMISIVLDPSDTAGIESLARQLHALECVEYASIQETLEPSAVLGGTGSCAILNVDPPICVAGLTAPECADLNGVFELNSDDCPAIALSELDAPTGACCVEIQTPLGPVVACIDVTAADCVDAGGQTKIAFWGPYTDEDGDGVFEPNEELETNGPPLKNGDPGPANGAWTCDDPNRNTACTDFEAQEGACCLTPGGTDADGGCVDETFILCKNQGGIFSYNDAIFQGQGENEDGLCVYGEDGDEEYECVAGEDLCSPALDIELGGCSGRLGNGSPGCADRGCCTAVGAIDPYCILFEDPFTIGVWDAYCQMIAGVLPACNANALSAANSSFSGIVYEKRWTGDVGASSPEIVRMVLSVDETCAQGEWDFRCAEIARLFAYRTAVVDGIGSGESTPDLREFQYNLTDLPWDYQSRDQFVAANEEGRTSALESEYYEDLPWISGWDFFGNPTRTWPDGFDGQGLGIRGQPGEPFDYDPAGPLDASNSNTGFSGGPGAGDGWYTSGENWRDWGVDGEPVRFIGSEDLLPVIGAGLDGTDVQLVGDPVNCDVVLNPLDFGLDPLTDLTAKDRGECDGLWTEPSGGDGFAWRIARDAPNGTGAPLLDQSGLMSEDPLVDRGDEMFRGRGAKVAVLDFSFWRGHEDIERIEMITNARGQFVPDLDADGQPKPTISWSRDTGNRYIPRKPYVIVEEGVTMITIPEIGYPDHGTAVLSTISALDELRDWGEPDQGISGVVPEAQPYFYPLISREDGPREVTAWFRAIQELGPGDVICGAYNPAGQTYCASQNEAIVTLTRDVAFNEGIVCVVAAGNERRDVLVEAGDGGGDDDGAELDGMMIVGAVTPSDDRGCLRHPESNWGEQVDFAAWGEHVVAAGYGDFFSGLNPDAGNDLSVSRTRAYTSQFGGTSAAAAQIAGVACALQGLAKQTFGIPAGAGALRDTAMVPYTYKDPNDPTGEQVDTYNTEWKQLPGRADFPDFTGQSGEIVDGQLSGVAEGLPGDPIRTGQFPVVWRWARDDTAVVQVVSLPGGVFENEVPGLLGVYPIKGTPSGNVYSLKGDDSLYFGLTSEFAYGFEGAEVPGELEGSPALTSSDLFDRALRPVSGQVTDLALLMQVDSNPNLVTGINADLRLQEPATLATVVGFDLWDNRGRRWMTTDVEVITGEDEPEADGDILVELESFEGIFVRRFINSDGLCWARIWTLSFGDVTNGDFNSGDSNYQLFWDLTNISFDIPGDNDGP